MEPWLVALIFTLWDALPGLSPEDREVIRNIDLLQELELTRELDLFVPEPDDGATEGDGRDAAGGAPDFDLEGPP